MSNVTSKHTPALLATDVAPRDLVSIYPAPFAARVSGRKKRKLGDHFGLNNFGVNLTILAPGSESALLHQHAVQDELIYIVSGTPDLKTDQGIQRLSPGMCAGFVAGGLPHHLINNSDSDVTYLEIGDRTAGESVTYPEDDLKAVSDGDNGWIFTKKDGTPH